MFNTLSIQKYKAQLLLAQNQEIYTFYIVVPNNNYHLFNTLSIQKYKAQLLLAQNQEIYTFYIVVPNNNYYKLKLNMQACHIITH